MIHPHSKRKYENNKSGLQSGMIKIHQPIKALNENPQPSELIDWIHQMMRDVHLSLQKKVVTERIEKIIDQREHEDFNFKRWVSKPVIGYESLIPQIEITNETSTEQFVEWILKQPRWEKFYDTCCEAMDIFLKVKASQKIEA